jgi:hypothetical protein
MLINLDAHDDLKNFQRLKEVLFASSAFPLAFAPQTVETCVAKSNEAWAHREFPFTCPQNEIESAEFVDGGILDNKPLALAEKLARTGLVENPQSQYIWREIPTFTPNDPRSSVSSRLLYFYSDLSATSYPRAPQREGTAPLSAAPMLLGSALNSSRNQDSSTLIEESPMLENQIAAPKNGVPRMGDSLIGFFGFFERDFRAFDFYLGLWETREFLKSDLRHGLQQGGQRIGNGMKFPAFMPDSQDEHKLSCLDLVLVDRQKVSPQTLFPSNICPRVSDRGFVQLARLAQARLLTRRTDFAFMAKWLADDGYEYRDLGLSKEDAWRAPAKIKTESIRAISGLADSQGSLDGFLIRAATPLAVNTIEPLPSENDFSVSLGLQTSLLFSSLVGEGRWTRTRWNFGIGLENLAAWLGSDSDRAVATPFIGFELEPHALNSSYLQTRFVLGGGYKFGLSETHGRCDSPSNAPDSCRGVILRAGSSLTIIERVRFGLDVEFMPFQKDANVPWQILPSLGLQFYF